MQADPRHLYREEQTFVRWHLRVPTNVSTTDLTTPAFWSGVAETVGVGDVVRVTRVDNAFDLEVVITARIAGNIRAERYPKEATI